MSMAANFLGPAMGPDWFKYLGGKDDPPGTIPPNYDGSRTLLDNGWAGLVKGVQDLYKQLELLAGKRGLWVRMTEGYRPFRRQAYLYALGRDILYVGKDGWPTMDKETDGVPNSKQIIVTWALPGQSNHQSGRAFDVALTGRDPWNRARLEAVGVIGEGLGLEWGGRWAPPKQDLPHFQLA